jgi:hypothetical protein
MDTIQGKPLVVDDLYEEYAPRMSEALRQQLNSYKMTGLVGEINGSPIKMWPIVASHDKEVVAANRVLQHLEDLAKRHLICGALYKLGSMKLMGPDRYCVFSYVGVPMDYKPDNIKEMKNGAHDEAL